LAPALRRPDTASRGRLRSPATPPHPQFRPAMGLHGRRRRQPATGKAPPALAESPSPFGRREQCRRAGRPVASAGCATRRAPWQTPLPCRRGTSFPPRTAPTGSQTPPAGVGRRSDRAGQPATAPWLAPTMRSDWPASGVSETTKAPLGDVTCSGPAERRRRRACGGPTPRRRRRQGPARRCRRPPPRPRRSASSSRR